MPQTIIQNKNSIPFGSVKFEMGNDLNTLINMGVGQNANFEETWEEVWLKPDNGPEELLGIRNHKCTFSMDLWEFDLEKFNNLRGGIDSYSTVAGTLVSGAVQTVYSGEWSYNKFIKIENQNGNGSQPAINSVTGSVDGLLTANTDYYVGQNEDGEWGIFVIDSTVVTTSAQNLTINYDYTPNAAKVLKTGGLVTVNSKIVRLTNENSLGKKLQLTIYKAYNSKGIAIAFKPDDAEEPNVIPVTISGVRDTSKIAGEQLFEIYNEQGA